MTLNELCELARKSEDRNAVCETAELKIQAVADHMMWYANPSMSQREIEGYKVRLIRLLVDLGSESAAKERKLVAALSDLYDEQNGPPLLRRQPQWERAMTASQKALGIKTHG